jgi:hypothetical protein
MGALTAPVKIRSSMAVDAAIVAYALWTITCHAVMLAHGNTIVLAWATMAVFLAGVLAVLGESVRRARVGSQGAERTPAESVASLPEAPRSHEQLLLAGLAAAVMAVWLWKHDPLLQWRVVLAYLLFAAAVCVRDTPQRLADESHAPRLQELGLWAVSLGSGLLSVWVHRWRNDDCYYVNLAVTTVDLPRQALLSLQTIHAPIATAPGANLVFTPYRIHSFEALGGLISFVTGIEPIRVLHIGMAGVAGALVPLALARLFRLLDRERWFYMLLAAMCLYLLDASGDRGFPNQGIVRMFTGKSVMLSVAVPLIVRHAIAVGQGPSLRRLALLASAQIAAIGLSSTALWLAPVAAMLGVLVPLRFELRSLRTIGAGLCSCLYVVAIALWVRSQLMANGSSEGGGAAAVAVTAAHFAPRMGLLLSSFEQNLGNARVTFYYLSLLLFSIPICRSLLGRRYLVVFCLALVLLLMNPYLANFLRYNVFGRYTGQRAFWVAPVPAAVAMTFTAAIATHAKWLRRATGIAAMCLGLWIFFSTVPSSYVLSRANNVIFQWPPRPKVPRDAFAMVREITALLPSGAVVLAPELVSWYLPTVQRHPFPLLANTKYLRTSWTDEHRRAWLVRFVSRHETKFGGEEAKRFASGLATYDVAGIVLGQRAMRTKGLTALIKKSGYDRVQAVRGYQLWIHRQPKLGHGR